MAQTVKNLPAMQETWVPSLDQEDPLEREMATHSNVLAWRIPWTEEPDGLQSMESQRVRQDWVTNTHTHTHTHTHTEQLWIKLLPIMNAYKQGHRPVSAVPCGYPDWSFCLVFWGFPWWLGLPTMQETQVRSLSQKDPLEKGVATHFSILAWRISWTEEPGRLQLRVRYNWLTNTFDSLASLNFNFLIHKTGMITSLLPVPELSRGLNVLEYIIYMKVEHKYINTKYKI